ncbi:tape measure protein [Dyadobacter fermentans]|uniref:tape measure protein n=1 Tax=Dyadobacter fermentans TaxID=94254 RepID=UPI001CBEDF5B|nr:tape measure protein [Dyadobacter fermentans]MBZ1362135.1 tape measure protein [Dyadobacter fermentans]
MTATVGGANIPISADATGVISALTEARRKFATFAKEVNADLSDAYKKADKEQRAFRNGLTRLGNDLQSFGRRIATLGALPTLFAAGAAYKTFADIEKLKIGLAQYGETIKTVKELAKLPNVSIEGAAQSLLQLRAVGVESNFAQRSITAFANALTAAGKSSTDLNPALTNIVQMLSTGVVSAADVKELANRIPQARKALIDAFGTASGEELTKKGVAKVVEQLIIELEKIPKVSGGAGMALEKLGDDAKFGLATIGESLDKSFGVTSLLNELSNNIGTLTEKFASLDPKTQKAIFAFAGMTVAIPALMTAIGGAITITTMFAAGIGVATGSVLAITAAVAVAGTAIIANWDDIKSSVGDTGVWKTLAGIGSSTLNALVELFKLAANLITADWENMGISLSNVLKNLGNLSVKLFGGLLKILPSMMGTLLNIDTSAVSKGIDKIVEAMQIEVPKSASIGTGAIERLRKKFEEVTGSIGNIAGGGGKVPPATGKGYEISARPYQELLRKEKEELKDRLAILKETKAIASDLKELNLSSSGGLQSTQSFGWLTNIRQAMSSPYMLATMGNERDWMGKLDWLTQRKGSLSAAKEKLSTIDDSRLNVATAGINRQNVGRSIRNDAAQELKDFLGSQTTTAEMQKYFDAFPKMAEESDRAYADRIFSLVDRTKKLSADLSGALQGAANEASIAFGELLGNLMTGAGGVEQFGKRVIGSLATMLKDMGKSLIAAGTAGIALKVFAKNPYLALAAGIGLVALGQATQNKVGRQANQALTRMAKGGLVYKETPVVVGDNHNAYNDPEMIAPYSKVHDSIKKSVQGANIGQPQVFIEDSVLKGEDIYRSWRRVDERNKSIFGG